MSATADLILERRKDLAEAVVTLQYDRRPQLVARYGPSGRGKCVEDVQYHLLFLAEAVANDSPALFCEYVAWAKVLFINLGIAVEDLAESLVALDDVLRIRLPGGAEIAASIVGQARAELDKMPGDLPSFIRQEAAGGELARLYLDALMAGDRHKASRLVMDKVTAGMTIPEVYLDVFQPALREVGRLWQMNRITVAHEHFATAATQAIMAQLYPHIFKAGTKHHTVIATCVGGELHEIGARMVGDCLELDGWDTHYLGANSPAKGIIRLLRERQADLLAVSATLTAHLHQLADLIGEVRQELEHLPILVGGYPFNLDPSLCSKLGADGWAADAAAAVAVARRLVAR